VTIVDMLLAGRLGMRVVTVATLREIVVRPAAG
jgi:hypothetical protein